MIIISLVFFVDNLYIGDASKYMPCYRIKQGRFTFSTEFWVQQSASVWQVF